jgi:hypothetical protein
VPAIVLLIVAGFHVPVIPLEEVVCKIGEVAPLQIITALANDGVINGLIVTVIVFVLAH